jgi:NitT/TauT family transport system substrate-binding protein
MRSLALSLGLALALSLGFAVTAQAQTKIRMVLNWKYEGPQGMFFLADDRGYFKEEGLEVTFDQGNGSGAAVPQVANGAYDAGFGDINALIELAAKKPEEAPLGVFMLYNRPPFTLAVKADSPFKAPADFVGRRLGGPANDAALKLLPALCAATKIDCGKIEIVAVQPNLREQMLMQGQVDGVFGYVTTIRFSAKLTGIDPDKQLRFIKFEDYGMELYSNAIIVSRKLAKEHPEAVKGFLKALNHGIKDAIADPQAAIDAVAKREPLIKPAIERARLDATMADEMSHPEIAKIGVGDVSDDHMAKAIDLLVKAKELPRTPKVGEIFDRSFLPPLAERPTSVRPAS